MLKLQKSVSFLVLVKQLIKHYALFLHEFRNIYVFQYLKLRQHSFQQGVSTLLSCNVKKNSNIGLRSFYREFHLNYEFRSVHFFIQIEPHIV